MNKIKLFIYPSAKKHIHDEIEIYKGLVPLSQEGIAKHCELVGPEQAQIYYMGQFRDNIDLNSVDLDSFEYFKKYPELHVADIEGDVNFIPNKFKQIIVTANSVNSDIKHWNIFLRPTFSSLLVHLVKNIDNFKLEYPKYKCFGFKGFLSNNVRLVMAQALKKSCLPQIIKFTNSWTGPNNNIDSESTQDYINILHNSSFCLAPRGGGWDSCRIYEICALGRIPIILSNNILVGENYYDTSFVIKINKYDDINYLEKVFKTIYNMSDEEIIYRCRMARQYFINILKMYFNDPTLMFLNYLKSLSNKG